jgi:hypothetical protein
MIKAEFKVIDRGLGQIVKDLVELNSLDLEVGLFDGISSADGVLTIGGLGYIQEKGNNSPEIPARPFTENTAIAKQDEISKFMVNEVGNLMKNRTTPKGILNSVGLKYSDFVKNTILEFGDPMNKPSTIAQKGFDDPLIETGKMYDSVKHRILGKL